MSGYLDEEDYAAVVSRATKVQDAIEQWIADFESMRTSPENAAMMISGIEGLIVDLRHELNRRTP